jgi:CBS domain-containing protein
VDTVMGEKTLKDFGNIKISEIMIKNPLFTTPDEKISATELVMLRKKVNGLPVVNDIIQKKVIGIITQRDIRLARFAMNLDAPNTTVKNLMTPEPYIIKENDTIKQALDIMFEKGIERLPVLNENKELVGLALQQNILKKLLEYLKS